MTQNERRLEAFADMLEPVGELLGDPEFLSNAKSGSMLKAAAMAIKAHKTAVISILAAMAEEDVESYEVPNPVKMTVQMLKFLGDPEIQELFIGQALSGGAARSGPATENTEDGAI